jgi:hypothetical protein
MVQAGDLLERPAADLPRFASIEMMRGKINLIFQQFG